MHGLSVFSTGLEIRTRKFSSGMDKKLKIQMEWTQGPSKFKWNGHKEAARNGPNHNGGPKADDPNNNRQRRRQKKREESSGNLLYRQSRDLL